MCCSKHTYAWKTRKGTISREPAASNGPNRTSSIKAHRRGSYWNFRESEWTIKEANHNCESKFCTRKKIIQNIGLLFLTLLSCFCSLTGEEQHWILMMMTYNVWKWLVTLPLGPPRTPILWRRMETDCSGASGIQELDLSMKLNYCMESEYWSLFIFCTNNLLTAVNKFFVLILLKVRKLINKVKQIFKLVSL